MCYWDYALRAGQCLRWPTLTFATRTFQLHTKHVFSHSNTQTHTTANFVWLHFVIIFANTGLVSGAAKIVLKMTTRCFLMLLYWGRRNVVRSWCSSNYRNIAFWATWWGNTCSNKKKLNIGLTYTNDAQDSFEWHCLVNMNMCFLGLLSSQESELHYMAYSGFW